MDAEAEKVYVTVGNDLQDNFKTLEWALKKWSSQPIHIVILHVSRNISKEFVHGPFGKLPASSVSEEVLEILKKNEQEKIDNLLSKCIAFCGKVKAEAVKVEKYDEPIHKLIVDLISGLHITKLVMGLTFMKSSSSSWKSKGAISGSFYVHRQKPDFCQLYLICAGKLVHQRWEGEDGIMEDDEGVMVAKLKEKSSFKGWFVKMFSDNISPGRHSSPAPPSLANLGSPDLQSQWERYVDEIEDYFQDLQISCEEDDSFEDCGMASPVEPDAPEDADTSMSPAEKVEALKRKIEEAHQTIQLKRKESQENIERHSKAEWAISLCNERIEDIEARAKEEFKNRVAIRKDLEAEKDKLYEVRRDTEESRSKLKSLLQLQSELSNKLQISNLAKVHAEARLEKAVITRAEMVREIEEFRRQRDVLQRRIEFCREKDTIEMVNRLNEVSCGFREYAEDEIRLATDNFSERLRLKSGGDWTNVYRGRINHATTVAVKILSSSNGLSQDNFQKKVRFLSQVRHPNIVAIICFCSELKCIAFEYMHSGSLRDLLYSPHKKSRRRNQPLRWHDRIRVAHDVASGLGFLHSAKPTPMIHGRLTPSNILLDRNLVAKISNFGLDGAESHDYKDVHVDIRAFGAILVQLLTGRNWSGLLEQAMTMDRMGLIEVLDQMAGRWPLDLAEELAGIALMCLSVDPEPAAGFDIGTIIDELKDLRRRADGIAARGRNEVAIGRGADRDDSRGIPNMFICPIFQEIMKNPHVAADGFSYELEAIEEWLWTGHDTSPMTNLKLKHHFLTPNHALRTFIQEWQSKLSAVDPL
ncbi:putative U-box domain-containing protein 50 isoform X1 [Syzygium oleosum]|uniref:putative U-box domain-containing protein 50 isoform X1 n=1 Tax=Syzygium oleosum TaxID=219896 RepID=UPI0011D1A99C|nr:putative U-box domain-containing protein 50 isoform X1 [Syzygium oleosum]